MCKAVLHYIIVVQGKYLQMMVAYHINKKEPDSVTDDFEKFNNNYGKLLKYFEKVTGESFKPGDNLDIVDNVKAKNRMSIKRSPPPPRIIETPKTDEVDPDVMAFLQKLKLTELKDIFAKEALTMDDIKEMTNADLKDIGVNLYKQRKSILTACKDLGKEEPKADKKEVKFRMQSKF